MSFLNIQLLGEFRLYDSGKLITTIATSRLQSLLAFLILHRDIPQPRHRIASLFWPDSSEAQAHTNLRNLIHLLRKALPDSTNYLNIDSSTIQWKPDSAFVLDVAELKKAMAAGAFEHVIDLFSGDLLPDCYDEWIISEREQLIQMYVDALERLIAQKKLEHAYHAAINYVQRLIHHEPVQEKAYCELMYLYALCGDRAGLIRTYNSCVKILQNELGVEPSIGTREMYARSQRMISTPNSTEELSTSDSQNLDNAIHISKSFPSTFTIILAGGRGEALEFLASRKATPAIPFAGRYCLIDFVLSNVANSNLNRVAVLTQYNSHSVIEHLKESEFWGPNLEIWEASIERTGQERYVGTADAVYQNRKFISKENCENLLILPGAYLCHQDYRDLLRFHQEKNADLTIVVTKMLPEETYRFGMVEIDRNQRIVQFVEKPQKTNSTLGSIGAYVFKTTFLLDCLESDANDKTSRHDFGYDIIPNLINSNKVYAYQFNGYWIDINTLDTYWKTNLALLGEEPTLNLHNLTWMLQNHSKNTLPVDIRPSGTVIKSLITEGCVIEGEVVHSILSPRVHIEKNVIVHDSIILDDAVVHNGAVIKGCLIGNAVEIGVNAHIGDCDDLTPNQTKPYLNSGITIIGRNSHIPANMTIGRNCYIDECTALHDFKALQIASGTTIRKSIP